MNSEPRTVDLRGCELRTAPEVADGAMTVQLRGEIDLANSSLVLDALTSALRRSTAGSFELDIAGVSFVDGRGVRALVALTVVAEAVGADYRIVGVQRQVRRAFELSSLTAFLDVYESDRQQPTADDENRNSNDDRP